MRNCNTCKTCTLPELNKEGKPNGKFTMNPDSECRCRVFCPDDGSSTDKREQVYSTLPLPEEIVKYEQCEAQI